MSASQRLASASRVARLSVVLVLLTGCVSAPRIATPPAPRPMPPPPADVAQIPDAVPRSEPRSTHGNPPSYDVAGSRYVILASADGYRERGVASWYGPDFHGKNTSSGELYDMYAMTAAHKTLPLPCYARVTNLANQRSVVVRINDRGPFVANRIIDLSYSAALRLDLVRTGTAFVEVETLTPDMTVAGAPAAPATAAMPAPTATGNLPAPLYVQVGAFADIENASRMSRRLRAAGLAPLVLRGAGADGRVVQRVRLGPIADVAAFDELIVRLKSLGIQGARLALDALVQQVRD